MVILENIDIDIDIHKEFFGNIDKEILQTNSAIYRLEFGISNRANAASSGN